MTLSFGLFWVFCAVFAYDCEFEGHAQPPDINGTCSNKICDCVLCRRVLPIDARGDVCVRFNHLGDYGADSVWQCDSSSAAVYASCYATIPTLMGVFVVVLCLCACCYIIAWRRHRKFIHSEDLMMQNY